MCLYFCVSVYLCACVCACILDKTHSRPPLQQEPDHVDVVLEDGACVTAGVLHEELHELASEALLDRPSPIASAAQIDLDQADFHLLAELAKPRGDGLHEVLSLGEKIGERRGNVEADRAPARPRGGIGAGGWS